MPSNKTAFFSAFLVSVSLALAALVFAGVPQTIHYQGYVKNGTVPASGLAALFHLSNSVPALPAVYGSTTGSNNVELNVKGSYYYVWPVRSGQ